METQSVSSSSAHELPLQLELKIHFSTISSALSGRRVGCYFGQARPIRKTFLNPVHSTAAQGPTNFPKIYVRLKNSRRKKGDINLHIGGPTILQCPVKLALIWRFFCLMHVNWHTLGMNWEHPAVIVLKTSGVTTRNLVARAITQPGSFRHRAYLFMHFFSNVIYSPKLSVLY
jgi:hypothetical protein